MKLNSAQVPFVFMSAVMSLFTPSDYSVVDGFFVQSGLRDGDAYDPYSASFGLVDTSEDRWRTFREKVDKLNAAADPLTVYKVIFAARHGQGWHNVAEEKYGTPLWNSYWSMKYTDGNITWGPDPVLTALGQSQAERARITWEQELEADAPRPETFYSSPMSRSAETLDITWKSVLENEKPLILEHLRETIGLHTCDKRSTKSIISKRFPHFQFDVPFSEQDQLWSEEFQESARQQALRTQQLLNRLFSTDASTYISITAHGGTIDALFRVLDHPMIKIPPGGMVPLVIKAVGHPSVTGKSFAGGHSRVAPPMTQPTNL